MHDTQSLYFCLFTYYILLYVVPFLPSSILTPARSPQLYEHDRPSTGTPNITPDVIPMDADDSPPSNIDEAEDKTEFFFKHEIDDKSPNKVPELSQQPPRRHTLRDLDRWAALLPPRIYNTLADSTGKHNPNHLWTTEIVFRHCLPPLLLSGFLDAVSFENLATATTLVDTFISLLEQYADVDTTAIRGFDMYENFAQETDFDEERCKLSSAALLHSGLFVAPTVRYHGGTHTGAHRDLNKIRRDLTPSVDPELLENLLALFERGAPNASAGHSSDENFMEYYRYGNHKSCLEHEDLFKQVMVKDSRRGNVILVDPRMTPFIPNLHLTPNSLVDVENKWKKPRPVFDATSHMTIASMAINDWINKITEGEVYFPGSFTRFLIGIYNLRITYPFLAIFVCDDDITNAFRLIKINPELVSMHAFQGCGKLALCTGNTFGNTNCPFNFDQPATARNQHASYLWLNHKDRCLAQEHDRLSNVTTEEMDPTIPFARVNSDSLNRGVVDRVTRKRFGPSFVGHVDDTLYVATKKDLKSMIACSFVAADETFGGNHKFQEKIISEPKLNMDYKETRVVLGYQPNTRTMMVELSPRRRDKTVCYIIDEGWLQPKKRATILEISQLLGLLQSICDIYLWGQAQLLVFQQLLGDCIRRGHNIAQRNNRNRVDERFATAKAQLPDTLSYRLRYLKMKFICEYVWRSNQLIVISDVVRSQLAILFEHLKAGRSWQCPIGHLIPRDPACESFGDASYHGIGVVNHHLKAIIVLPFRKELHMRMHEKKVHINTMELLALFLSYIMFLTAYEADPTAFLPHPIIKLWGDNMSANKWFRTVSTSSPAATAMLLLMAEYIKDSPVKPEPDHIPGKYNIEGDDLSRLYTLFQPEKKFIYDLTFTVLLRQVCRKYKNMENYSVFLINPEIKSDLTSLVYSDSLTAVPKRKKIYGRFFPVKSIFSGSAINTIYSNSFSL